MNAYRPPLTRAELAALIAYTTSPPLAPLHPLDAAELLRPTPDLEHEAAVDRILASVNPPTKLRPVQLSKQGLDRLLKDGAYWSPPSRATPWKTWISDLYKADCKMDLASNVPRAWWHSWWPPMYWMGQFVPNPRGAADGCYWVWRKVAPWPSTAGTTPATLDDLAAIVDAARARRLARLGLPPAQRRSWRELLQPWAEERERTYEAARAAAASGAT